MFHQTFPAGDASAIDLTRELTLLAANLDAHFLHAGTTLADAIAMIDRIVGGLDMIVEALDERHAGAASADLAHVADRIADLPATLAARGAGMSAIARISSSLRRQVLDMHKSLRVLGIYGVNIKIAASGEAQFVGFVDGMGRKLADGERLLLAIVAQLKDLETGLDGGRQIDRLLEAECRKVVPAVPQRLAADAGELDGHLRKVAALARRVADIARSVQAKVAVLLGALQVGDSTRQRLEHVVAALQIVTTHGCTGGSAAHVDRLLAAQVEGVVTDFAREVGALIDSLAGLEPDVGALQELIAEQAGTEGRGVLSRLNDSVTEMDCMVVQLQSAQVQAREMTGLIAATVTDIARRVGDLGDIRRDVQDIATNTRLMCRRHGNVGRAVSVVATEVERHARELGDITKETAGTVERLGRTGALPFGPAGERDITAVLGGALDVIRTACQRTEQVVLERGDDAARLVELIAGTAAELQRELAVTGAMDVAALALTARAAAVDEPASADDQALCTAMAAIARTYTMAQERDIHAAFLLPGMEGPAPAAATVEEDEDDDGLF